MAKQPESCPAFRTTIGGQALIEGIMMLGPDKRATVVRKPDGELEVKEEPRKLIKDNNLTAMMVTHNMKDALQYGNRTIMLHEGKIIIDIDREMKARMTVEDLLKMFKVASGSGLANDRMLLSN